MNYSGNVQQAIVDSRKIIIDYCKAERSMLIDRFKGGFFYLSFSYSEATRGAGVAYFTNNRGDYIEFNSEQELKDFLLLIEVIKHEFITGNYGAVNCFFDQKGVDDCENTLP